MQRVDHELLSQLLDEHGPALVLYAQQWSSTPEDVVQEAFIKLMRESPVPANIVGWMYRVVRNTAISASRAGEARARHERQAACQREPWFHNSDSDGVDGQVVASLLASLPIEQREVIVLRLWSGLPFQQIADLVGTSTSTVHRRYEDGVAKLRRECDFAKRVDEANQ